MLTRRRLGKSSRLCLIICNHLKKTTALKEATTSEPQSPYSGVITSLLRISTEKRTPKPVLNLSTKQLNIHRLLLRHTW